jgi:3-oxosteroid 1-dehydrogenase
VEDRLVAGERFDVIVVGSGAGGLLAAIRAHDLGCSVAVIEKTAQFGGTTARSAGGTWVPLNDAIATKDSKDLAMQYLRSVTQGRVRDSMLEVYVDQAAPVTRYLKELGITYVGGSPWPDYFSDAPGALRGRSMLPADMDGMLLGTNFATLRDSHPSTRLLNRYSLNSRFAFTLSNRAPGWRKTLAKIFWDYWSDLPWRLRTWKDRRLTMGRAVIGGLRKAMMNREIPLLLESPLTGFVTEGRRVIGVRITHEGRAMDLHGSKGVILACGGFENSQALRDQHLLVRTQAAHSAAPPDGANTGDALGYAATLGATLDCMGNAWWCPCVCVPRSRRNGSPVSYPIFFDRAKPGSLTVNKLGRRFVSESVSYDMFGLAMVQDQLATGANTPCWMLFDSRFRQKYAAGPVLPSWAMSDRSVPSAWWNSVVYRADDLTALAGKIGVPAQSLLDTVERFNRGAAAGVDSEFSRGSTDAQRAIGDASVKPNPSLAPLDQGPYYAIRMELGDLGTRGGLKINECGAVLDHQGAPIGGLYAAGDVAATLFGDTYPGGGCAIASAFVFGYLAANDIAKR